MSANPPPDGGRRRRASLTTAMIERALNAGKRVGVPVALKWDAPQETLTIIPCSPMEAVAGDSDAIAEAIANFKP